MFVCVVDKRDGVWGAMGGPWAEDQNPYNNLPNIKKENQNEQSKLFFYY